MLPTPHGTAHLQRAGLQRQTKHGVFHAPSAAKRDRQAAYEEAARLALVVDPAASGAQLVELAEQVLPGAPEVLFGQSCLTDSRLRPPPFHLPLSSKFSAPAEIGPLAGACERTQPTAWSILNYTTTKLLRTQYKVTIP